MHEQSYRLNCAYILVLSTLLHSTASHCRPEFAKDTISNEETSNYVAEEQRNKLDPSIVQIFRGPIEKRNDVTESKRNLEVDSLKPSVQSYQETEKRVRVKRENPSKRNSGPKSTSQPMKTEAKRSFKSDKASSRTTRTSRDLPRLRDKDSANYDASVDQEGYEYADEADEESATGSKGKESGYKGRELHAGEDSDRFIDQEERSSLYDDFETKEVAKRGISGSEDYEELEDEPLEPDEDAAVDEQESLDDETDKKKLRGDTRVKREHDSSKAPANLQTTASLQAPASVQAPASLQAPANLQTSAKLEDPGNQADSASDVKVSEGNVKRSVNSEGNDKASESQMSKADSNEQEPAKRNAVDKQEGEAKVNSEREAESSKQQSSAANDQAESRNSENSKGLSQDAQETTMERKTQESGSTADNKATNDLANEVSAKGCAKADESKVVEALTPETTKVDGAAETSPAKDVAKLDSAKSAETVPQEQEEDYEKRVEEQIQRKIDSIKEEIKREIAKKQRIREIEENNAKFDELHEQEEENEEQAAESEPSEKRENVAKRSAVNPEKSRARESIEKEPTRRKKRHNDDQVKGQSRVSESGKKLSGGMVKKRTSRSELTPILKKMPIHKRDNPREVILVRNERNAGKKKRRRRSKSSILIPEQRSVKLQDNLPADVVLDSSVREGVGDAKDSFSEKKSGSVASLTGNGEELGPLATEYGDAFGGLQGEPGVALARFKRIKRVLRPQPSKN